MIDLRMFKNKGKKKKKAPEKVIVYVIGRTENLVMPYDDCYVGITSSKSHRWEQHAYDRRKKNYLWKFIAEHSLNKNDNMITVFEGTRDECLSYEHDLRPIPHMGLNRAPGGKSGVHFNRKGKTLDNAAS